MGLINAAPTGTTPATQTTGGNQQQVTKQAIEQVKPFIKMIAGAQNPAEMMQQICMQNPAFRTAYENAMRLAGNDPKGVFYSLAKQQGLDPDELVKAMIE